MGINNPGGSSFTDIVMWHDETLAAAGRFDVTNIPQGYSFLAGNLLSRSNQVTIGDNANIFFNGDTTLTNYRYAQQFGGATHGGGQGDNTFVFPIPGASSPANYFGVGCFYIFRYTGAHQKIIQILSSVRQSATDGYTMTWMLHWENTAAINRITLQPDGYATDTFVAGSRLQIWLYI